MEFRNPTYNRHGTIDCEIDHPHFGWIPFTASPDDVEPATAPIHDAIVASGVPIAPYVPPPEPAPLTAEQKLARLGLTTDDLKALLG